MMYLTFLVMMAATLPLGLISSNTLGLWGFTALLVMVGVAMGVGKASVFKYIPEYFPKDVGAVGGLVGALGALGGFFLPPLFAYTKAWTGAPHSVFFILFLITLASMAWLHTTVVVIKRITTNNVLLEGQ